MLRIAICDDDPAFTLQTGNMLERWPQKPENMYCETFSSSDELINVHKASPFDIILLDIVMPMINGMEAAREIRQLDKNVKIIFLTSSPEYAVESYTIKANNYLLKPVLESTLFACVDELVGEIRKSAQMITVKSTHMVQKLAVDRIVYIEAQNKHTIFAMLDGSTVESIEAMHTCEEKIAASSEFIKCHRSYVVNINYIDQYTSKEIRMHNGCSIPISRSYQKAFESAYYSVLFGEAGEDNDR